MRQFCDTEVSCGPAFSLFLFNTRKFFGGLNEKASSEVGQPRQAYEAVGTVLLDGQIPDSVLLAITEFVDESDSLQKQKALRVWRTLSRANLETADGAARLPSVADHVFLNFKLPDRAYKKFDFLINRLKVKVTHLTIDKVVSCTGVEINALGERMAKCTQLQSVSIALYSTWPGRGREKTIDPIQLLPPPFTRNIGERRGVPKRIQENEAEQRK